MMYWSERGNIRKKAPCGNPSIRNTRGFTGGWTMGPSMAWFYEGQLRLHRNIKHQTSKPKETSLYGQSTDYKMHLKTHKSEGHTLEIVKKPQVCHAFSLAPPHVYPPMK